MVNSADKPESSYRVRALEALVKIVEGDLAYNLRIEAAKVILEHTGAGKSPLERPTGHSEAEI